MTTHLKPRSTTVALYQGDDMDRLAHLKRAVDIAERQLKASESEAADNAGTARVGDDTSDETAAGQAAVGAARDAFDAFVDDAAGRALSVELRSIGRRRFAALLADHPPRKVAEEVETERTLGEDEVKRVAGPKMVDHPDDVSWGVNTESFPLALLTFHPDDDPECMTIAGPAFDSDGDRRRFVDDELAEGDFEQLWVAAWSLNRSPSADPNALRYGTASLSTDET